MSQETGSEASRPESPARRIIARFGGIRPMAAKLGVAVSTVQGWRERGVIPAARHGQIRAAARDHGVALDPAELAASAPDGPEAEAREAEPVRTPEAAAETPKAPETLPPPRRPGAIPPSRTGPAGAGPGRAMLIGAGVLAAGVLFAVMLRGLWLPLVGPANDGTRLAALETRLGALESAAPAVDPASLARLERGLTDQRARLAELEARGIGAAEIAALGGRVDDLTARLEALSGLRARIEELSALEERVTRLGTLQARVETLEGLEARVAALGALETRIEALAKTGAEAHGRLASETALALAVLELRDALRGSAPFARAYATLESLAKSGKLEDGPALAALIAPLGPLAEAGVPSLPLLQAEFSEMAGAIVAAAQGGDSEGWVSGVVRRASGLVTIRPVGPVAGESVPAVVARAEFHLGEGDLAAALGELAALSGRPAAAATAWRARALARQTVREVLAGLSERLVRRVETAGG